MSDVHEQLREWARGSLPAQAAVEFLIETGTLYERHPMIGQRDDRAWLDLFEIDAATWAERTGTMSGGERATWEIARSIVAGELEDTFWRLDGSRKAALVNALARNAH